MFYFLSLFCSNYSFNISFGRQESNNYKYDPFIPTNALGVDMFPHTSHYELVVVLKRFKAT